MIYYHYLYHKIIILLAYLGIVLLSMTLQRQSYAPFNNEHFWWEVPKNKILYIYIYYESFNNL